MRRRNMIRSANATALGKNANSRGTPDGCRANVWTYEEGVVLKVVNTADEARAFFVLLHLLERDHQLLSKLNLGHAAYEPAHSHAFPDLFIDGTRVPYTSHDRSPKAPPAVAAQLKVARN